MTDNWILKSIEPKSDQLNADDLLAGPIDVTVRDVKKGNAEQPIVIEIGDDRQPFKPGKSMRRVLVKVWGDSPKKWIGQQMRLYCDPNVKFGGMKVGGIRISHMTGIDTRCEIMLTVTRGKKMAFVIEPMPEVKQEAKPEASDRVTKAIKWLAEVDDFSKLDDMDKSLTELIESLGVDEAERVKQARKAAVARLMG